MAASATQVPQDSLTQRFQQIRRDVSDVEPLMQKRQAILVRISSESQQLGSLEDQIRVKLGIAKGVPIDSTATNQHPTVNGRGHNGTAQKKSRSRRMIVQSATLKRYTEAELPLPQPPQGKEQAPLHAWLTRSMMIRGPMGVSELVAAIQKDGYRSDAKKPDAVVIQTLNTDMGKRFAYSNERKKKNNKYDYVPTKA